MKNTGWRKPTPGLGRAEQFAQAGERLSIGKIQSFGAAKKAGVLIGLRPADLMLLDTLGAFSKAQDWEEGRRPIVWASNDTLMARTGFSRSALKRHLRRLAEAGVIAFRDSPNGKRWGRRDAEGHITEAYGFDLTPLAARAEEFETLYAAQEAERAAIQRVRRQITVLRRQLRAEIELALEQALSGAWARFQARFTRLMAELPGSRAGLEDVQRVLSRLRTLAGEVQSAFRRHEIVENPALEAEQSKQMDPRETVNEPHILTTNELQSVESNSLEKGRPEASDQETFDGAGGLGVELATVMQACPDFAQWVRNLGGYMRDWGDVHRAVGQLRPMIGVSEHAWQAAQDGLGSQRATAAMVLVFDKHCTGEISSPGGYLRGMVQKAQTGTLHLERSIYGRLAGQAA